MMLVRTEYFKYGINEWVLSICLKCNISDPLYYYNFSLVLTNVDPCGENKPLVMANSETGELTSPSYPKSYPNNADCQWHLNVDDDFLVQLSFVEFDVEDG